MNGKFTIPLRVVNRAVEQGIPLASLREMVVHSARITHPMGNRRFHNYVFQVEGTRVVDFTKIDHVVSHHRVFTPKPRKRLDVVPAVESRRRYACDTCQDTDRVVVHDECPHCEQEGCQLCDGKGEVQSTIPCPACHQRKRLRKVS